MGTLSIYGRGKGPKKRAAGTETISLHVHPKSALCAPQRGRRNHLSVGCCLDLLGRDFSRTKHLDQELLCLLHGSPAFRPTGHAAMAWSALIVTGASSHLTYGAQIAEPSAPGITVSAIR